MAKELETRSGLAERWATYIYTALTYIHLTPEVDRGKGIVQLLAVAPGFEGLAFATDPRYEITHQLIYGLENWLEYRLANHLPIPRIPGAAPPTLQDFEEYDAIRADDRAKALQDLLADEIPLPAVVRARQFALVSEHVLARDWLAPGEDEAWQHL